jgi:CheY-like chemotaxis protein
MVDDDSAVRDFKSQRLQHLGHSVSVCDDVVCALENVEAHPARHDLILTEQTMPGLGGLELAEQLHEAGCTVPTVIMSGHSPKLTPEALQAAGVDHRQAEPFGVESEPSLGPDTSGRKRPMRLLPSSHRFSSYGFPTSHGRSEAHLCLWLKQLRD